MTFLNRLKQLLAMLVTRCGTSVVDFGSTPAYTANVAVYVGVNGVSPRTGCVSAQIALSDTAALGDSPGHTQAEHIDHSMYMKVLCSPDIDADGNVQITVATVIPRFGRYAINIQRIV